MFAERKKNDKRTVDFSRIWSTKGSGIEVKLEEKKWVKIVAKTNVRDYYVLRQI